MRTTQDYITATFFVALLYMLVRPNSKAVQAINAVTKALVGMVRTATDL